MGILFALLFWASAYAQTKWTITDEYSIAFTGKGADGTFTGLSGEIYFDQENLDGSRFDVMIDPSTISTGNSTKDKHARGDSWFDVSQYSSIRFQSDQITKRETGYRANGFLTLHGITKRAQIDFDFAETGNDSATFSGILIVNRQDFGIEGPFISFMVGDEFEVSLEVRVE